MNEYKRRKKRKMQVAVISVLYLVVVLCGYYLAAEYWLA